MRRRSTFGSYTRAIDGCIVTFRMPDDSLEVRHFTTIISESRLAGIRKGRRHADQVVDWADEHDAKVVCISTPETIFRDLQGTRAELEPHPNKKHPADSVRFPEPSMLTKRPDLFELPGRPR